MTISLKTFTRSIESTTVNIRGIDVPVRALSLAEHTFIETGLLGRPQPPSERDRDGIVRPNFTDVQYVVARDTFTHQLRLLCVAAAINYETETGLTFRAVSPGSQPKEMESVCAWRDGVIRELPQVFTVAEYNRIIEAFEKVGEGMVEAAEKN